MSRPLVVGIGNPLRGDDGIGPQVAHVIAQQRPDVDVLAVHQLAPEHAEIVSRASIVVIVDACESGLAGLISTRSIHPSTDTAALALSHHIGPELLLAMAQRLFLGFPSTTLVTVAGTDFGMKEELSAEVRQALPRAVAVITEFIDANAPALG